MHHAAAEGVEVLDTELDVVVQEDKPRLKLLGNAAPLFDEQGNPEASAHF